MQVTFDQVYKSFGRQTIIRAADHRFGEGTITGITGPNGSGKSTLLQLASGALRPDKGAIHHSDKDSVILPEQVFRSVSIAAPYLNLYDELSLEQAVTHHVRFKPLRTGNDPASLIRRIGLEAAAPRPVGQLSSGMRQRLKLGLAILSDSSLLLLDEPGTNLDAEGIDWFQQLLDDHRAHRTVIICSNRQDEELTLCDRRMDITAFKGRG